MTHPIDAKELAADIVIIARRALRVTVKTHPGMSFAGEVEGIERMAEAAAQAAVQRYEESQIRAGAGFTFKAWDNGAISVRWPAEPDNFARVAFSEPGTRLYRIALHVMNQEAMAAGDKHTTTTEPSPCPSK